MELAGGWNWQRGGTGRGVKLAGTLNWQGCGTAKWSRTEDQTGTKDDAEEEGVTGTNEKAGNEDNMGM